jgi:hypothetical protein
MSQDLLTTEYYLESDILQACLHFADRVVPTNEDEYSKRKQSNLKKIRQDVFIGQLAVWGVYFIYLQRGHKNIEPPDMRVYEKNKKSFDPDLRYGLYNLHIKAQSYESSVRYGDSWVFQTKDPLFAFNSEYDIMVGCKVCLDMTHQGALVQILLEKPFGSIVFGETKMSKFADNKKAVYLKDNR